MKAVSWNNLDAQPTLRDDLPVPSPGTGEVLVRVQASSINPVDNAIAAGMLKDMVPHEFPSPSAATAPVRLRAVLWPPSTSPTSAHDIAPRVTKLA